MGHGRIGKHRHHPGGVGACGGFLHMRVWYDRYHPGWFGKVGDRNYRLNPDHFHCPIINVENLWALAGEEAYKQAKDRKDGKALVIDCVEKGIFKVCGKGELPKIPMIVKAKFFSKEAEEKIKAAGGACILRA